MKIYIGHSRNFDYKKELYEPIINSELFKEEEIIFPHLTDKVFDTNKVIEASDLFIAEVSYPSLGLGIEIGRAEMKNKNILCICQSDKKIPSCLKYVKADCLVYIDEKDLINKISKYIKSKI